jgi:uncharacterized membrane protein
VLNLPKYRLKLIVSLGYLFSGALVILMLRLAIPTSKTLFHLTWNLFLAYIPLAFSTLVLFWRRVEDQKSLKLVLLVLWLCFFPNAPYIWTDYLHVIHGDTTYFLLDLITWLYFAILGFAVAAISLNDVSSVLMKYFNKHIVTLLIFIVCLLTSIGIYLGRGLRFNTWDIFRRPNEILIQSLDSIQDFHSDFITWIVSCSIGIALFLTYSVMQIKERAR